MAFKRALVVDDSKSARISLKKLLEDQGLDVRLADCGEAAIDLLNGELVDVIFMDHTMPGMDGLEALTAIKSDPRTATIPVMMYTTKEGEVYVSQARALGALGVLPKQFQPHVLFDMLLELGLVTDRRSESGAPRAEPPAPEPEPPSENKLAKAESDYDQQALGISVQALVTRILEDQHLTLRADILQSHRDFARQVAAEVYERQRAENAQPSTPDSTQEDGSTARNPSRLNAGSILMTVATAVILVLASLYWQTLQSHRALEQSLSVTRDNLEMAEDTLLLALQRDRETAPADQSISLLSTLGWAANRNPTVAFNEYAFDEGRARELTELLDQLSAISFTGEVLVESHLGAFCLISNDAGSYDIAPAELELLNCSLVGHPNDDSSFSEERQSPAFREFIGGDAARRSGIELRLVAHDRLSSEIAVAYPRSATTAGDWNRAAARNNRVEVSVIAAANP